MPTRTGACARLSQGACSYGITPITKVSASTRTRTYSALVGSGKQCSCIAYFLVACTYLPGPVKPFSLSFFRFEHAEPAGPCPAQARTSKCIARAQRPAAVPLSLLISKPAPLFSRVAFPASSEKVTRKKRKERKKKERESEEGEGEEDDQVDGRPFFRILGSHTQNTHFSPFSFIFLLSPSRPPSPSPSHSSSCFSHLHHLVPNLSIPQLQSHRRRLH